MSFLKTLTTENFENNFNIKKLIENSAFYPASGIDGCHLQTLRQEGINSFVHVDYSIPEDDVQQALEHHFTGMGYRIVGLTHLTKEQITPNGFRPIANIPFNEHERNRLNQSDIRDRMNAKDFTPFALWAVYELDPRATGSTVDKVVRFSILHIGGEACATFEALYLSNGINPTAVVIINPAEGYGDNWTLFTDPDFRLYQLMKMNSKGNNQLMPKYFIINENFNNSIYNSCWPEYEFKDRFYEPGKNWLNLFLNNCN
jgi:hypothetical protein